MDGSSYADQDTEQASDEDNVARRLRIALCLFDRRRRHATNVDEYARYVTDSLSRGLSDDVG